MEGQYWDFLLAAGSDRAQAGEDGTLWTETKKASFGLLLTMVSGQKTKTMSSSGYDYGGLFAVQTLDQYSLHLLLTTVLKRNYHFTDEATVPRPGESGH